MSAERGRLWRHPEFALLLFAAAYGIRISDRVEFDLISADPFRMGIDAEHQFLYSSPLPFLLGSYYRHHGLDPSTAFWTVQVAAVFLLGIAMWRMLRTCSDNARAAVIWVLAASPLLLVLLSFVGKSDPILIAGFLLMATTTSRGSVMVFSAAMVLAHRELAVAILAGYACLEPSRVRRLWPVILGGVLAGEALVWCYTNLLVTPPPSSRESWALGHAALLWSAFSTHPMIHIAATFGPFWLLLLSPRRWTGARLLVAMLAVVLAAASADFTRVFVLVATPLLFTLARDLASDLTRDGYLPLGPLRLAPQWIVVFVFVQIQLAGAKVLWARGIDWFYM